MTPRRIDVTPSWAGTAKLLLVLLESGDENGQAFAKAEILRMGQIIDKLQEGKK